MTRWRAPRPASGMLGLPQASRPRASRLPSLAKPAFIEPAVRPDPCGSGYEGGRI